MTDLARVEVEAKKLGGPPVVVARVRDIDQVDKDGKTTQVRGAAEITPPGRNSGTNKYVNPDTADTLRHFAKQLGVDPDAVVSNFDRSSARLRGDFGYTPGKES